MCDFNTLIQATHGNLVADLQSNRLHTHTHTHMHMHTHTRTHTLCELWTVSKSWSYTSFIQKACIMCIYTKRHIDAHFSTCLYTCGSLQHTHTHIHTHTHQYIHWVSSSGNPISLPAKLKPGRNRLHSTQGLKHIYRPVGGWHKKAIRIKHRRTWALAELLQLSQS